MSLSQSIRELTSRSTDATEADLSRMFDQLISSVDTAMYSSQVNTRDTSELLSSTGNEMGKYVESSLRRADRGAPATVPIYAPEVVGRTPSRVAKTPSRTPRAAKTPGASGSRYANKGSFSQAKQRSQRKKAATPARVRLSARPTPYEVWSERQAAPQHQMALAGRTPRSVRKSQSQRRVATTKEEQDANVDRMLMVQKQKVFERMTNEQRKAAMEELACTFKPTINANSQRMVPAGVPRLHERYQEEQERSAAMLVEASKRFEAYKMEGVTFAPNLSQTKSANAQLAAAGRTPRGRVEDRCVQFAREKEADHARMRAQLARAEEDLCTFEPRINANSRRVATSKFRTTSSRGGVVVTGTRRDPGHEEETFQPRLATSRRRVAGAAAEAAAARGPVHERLYGEAERQRGREAAAIAAAKASGQFNGSALAPAWRTTQVARGGGAAAEAEEGGVAEEGGEGPVTTARWGPSHYFLYRAMVDARERRTTHRSPRRRY